MNPATIELTAPDISCAKCKDNIEGDLGIQQVSVDVDAHRVRIGYDPQRTTPAQLRARLAEIGYPADP
jgi:copper chaperone CopZ